MSITLEQYQDKLRELARQGSEKAIERVVVPAANELLANIKNRIIRDGQNSAGQKIGNYSTKPAYFEKEQFIQKGKFKGIGKTGQTKYASGAMHKSMYLPQGYKQLRDIQGRQTQFINEFYTGDTMLAYQMQPKDKEVLLGLTTERAAKIRHGQEAKRGRIFSATEEEIKEYNENVSKHSADLLTSIFNA